MEFGDANSTKVKVENVVLKYEKKKEFMMSVENRGTLKSLTHSESDMMTDP